MQSKHRPSWRSDRLAQSWPGQKRSEARRGGDLSILIHSGSAYQGAYHAATNAPPGQRSPFVFAEETLWIDCPLRLRVVERKIRIRSRPDRTLARIEAENPGRVG